MKKALLLVVTASALFAGTVAYTYDTAGRLTKADYGAAGSIAYEYDKAGNLTKRTVTGPPPPAATSSEKAKSPKEKKVDPKVH